jgi:hypothetical protein
VVLVVIASAALIAIVTAGPAPSSRVTHQSGGLATNESGGMAAHSSNVAVASLRGMPGGSGSEITAGAGSGASARTARRSFAGSSTLRPSGPQHHRASFEATEGGGLATTSLGEITPVAHGNGVARERALQSGVSLTPSKTEP